MGGKMGYTSFTSTERRLIASLSRITTRENIAAACSHVSGIRRTAQQVRGYMLRRRLQGRRSLTRQQAIEVAECFREGRRPNWPSILYSEVGGERTGLVWEECEYERLLTFYGKISIARMADQLKRSPSEVAGALEECDLTCEHYKWGVVRIATELSRAHGCVVTRHMAGRWMHRPSKEQLAGKEPDRNRIRYYRERGGRRYGNRDDVEALLAMQDFNPAEGFDAEPGRDDGLGGLTA